MLPVNGEAAPSQTLVGVGGEEEDSSSAPRSSMQSSQLSASTTTTTTPDPVCSVLNVVIDYVMVPPTALEPQEWQRQQEKDTSRRIQQPQEHTSRDTASDKEISPSGASPRVPVLRVFGPIVRRDTAHNANNNKPYQSACLYVHGAFPYLLARPRIAGPDGSLHPFRSEEERHIDWDDFEAVERIVPILMEALERSIVASSSFGSHHQDSNNKTTQQQDKSNASVACIREITVVLGRGFYSYAPGPPAPFLRVEYNDPSERWKVKRALEQGLDVDALYHPDARQYTTATGQGPVRMDDSALLRFHCYEAHIPYTMQFFKDYNLAGLSYIHVRNPRFRNLPRQRRQTFALYKEAQVDNQALFLESNASQYLWPVEPPLSSLSYTGSTPLTPPVPNQEDRNSLYVVGMNNQQQQGQSCSSQKGQLQWCWHPPPRRETVCDVELDVHARDILNVLDILTEQQEDNVHWRAVPSLRELWAEERQRMSLLLPETEENRVFTLAVKTPTSAQPGTKLAVEGMERLLASSENFVARDFDRAVQQIIQRYKPDIENVDEAWRHPPKKLLGSPTDASSSASDVVLTPDFSQALDALENMGDEKVSKDKEENSSSREETISSPEQTTFAQEASFSQNELSQHIRFDNATQSYYNGAKLAPAASEKELTQRIDRGEAVVDGPFHHVEDFIDPTTLRPYDLLEDEDSIGFEENANADEFSRYKQVESEMQVMATQTCEGNQSAVDTAVEKQAEALINLNDDQESEIDDSEEEGLLELHDSSDDDTASNPLESSAAKQRQEPSAHPKTLLPPRRSLLGNADLLSLPARNQAPSWLGHTFNYLKEWGDQSVDSWFPPVGPKGIDVRLSRRAPTRRQVLDWLRRDKRKRDTQELDGDPSSKKQKRQGSTLTKQTAIDVNLVLDSNTRKLVATTLDVFQKRGIEEVEWELTQPGTQGASLSQQSQGLTTCIRDLKQHPTDACASESKHLHEKLSLAASSPVSPGDADHPDTPTDYGGSPEALQGIGNQGGRLWVEGGGTLKAKTRHSQASVPCKVQDGKRSQSNRPRSLATPITMMSVEIHVQCRTGRAGLADSKQIAMVPNSDRDKIVAVVYLFAKDPGGGEKLQILERGCIFVPVERELCEMRGNGGNPNLKRLADAVKGAIPKYSMGIFAPTSVECVEDERKLLLRLSAKVLSKDPDMLLSWEPQGSGLGYIVERGILVGQHTDGQENTKTMSDIDMARLLGRLRKTGEQAKDTRGANSKDDKKERWKGSGLGKDWDERVGPGVAAASIEGRLVFSTWKLVAEEVKHPNASYLQAIVSSVLNRRIPFHDNLRLTQWYSQDSGRERHRVLHHKLTEATCGLLLLDALDIVGRAGEAARLSGVEFSQSFPGIRGSQYKVEGVLLRALKSLNSFERGSKRGIAPPTSSSSAESPLSAETKSQTQSPWKARRLAHPVNGDDKKPVHELSDRAYFFFSPSLEDTNRQEALEVQALTLEPESGHIMCPVVVCDFTALYPSLIIAYNLCFSTCAGQLEYHSTRSEMAMEGKSTGKVGPMSYPEDRTATVLKHHIKSTGVQSVKKNRMYVTPSRSMFVAESVVKGVLPQVLDEMLSTRAMLKKAAKQYKKSVPNLSPAVLRQLEARQLALKYVANVTYGYTSATFSGRCSMPLLADTIVECARRTLKNAIDLANEWGMDETGKWYGCRCVYGDTDSVFVRLPGKTVKEAFRFGEEFCKAVTKRNPPPVQLKLEKVYLGSILQTKKKYCGMKFESKDEKKPVFEAKGIETVRRDQCALTQKVLRNCLVTLFTKGIEAVKTYLFRQWSLILSRSLPVSDFILTGRVRSRYRGDGVGPVQAVLARRLAEADSGRVVRHKERVPYVVVATPGVKFKLRDGVLTPMELLEQWDAYVLNTAYYITKHVNPALDRCLSLPPHRIEVASWFSSCPKPRRRVHFWPATIVGSNSTLSRFFGSSICALCGGNGEVQGNLKVSLCQSCKDDRLASMLSSLDGLSKIQAEMQTVAMKCGRCSLTYEDASTFAVIRSVKGSARLPTGVATPLANCSCIDCPVTFERHRLREAEIEALEVCAALKADVD